MCCTNERYKSYQTRFLFFHLGHVPGIRLLGAGVAQGVKIYIFFKHGHVAYQIDGDDEQNKMLVKFLPWDQTGDFGVRSKGQKSINFGNHVTLNFYTKLRVFSHK